MAIKSKGRMLSLLVVGGLLLVIGGFLYQSGFRIAPVPTPQQPAGEEQARARQPGEHPRQQQAKAGGTRPVRIQSGTPSTEPITVIANGNARSLTSQDLQALEQVSVVGSRGVRAGWRVTDVLKELGVAPPRELVLIDKAGKSLSAPWEKITNPDTTSILTYNQMGGLMLVSGKEITSEELQTATRRSVNRATKEHREDQLFFANIVKIEVKT
jgi:hypothetical protein